MKVMTWLLGLALSAPVVSASTAAPELSLSLSWLDAWGVCPLAAIAARDETTRALGELGIRIRWIASDELPSTTSPRLGVVLVAFEPSTWRLDASTLGAVKGVGDAPRDVVFVFTSNVFRLTGEAFDARRCQSVGTQFRIGRALSRVIVHEIVHAFAPRHPHAEEGLLSPSLSRKSLLARSLDVDALCALALVSRLEDW